MNFAKNSVGTPEIINTNNYYPFGLNHTGGNGINTSKIGSFYSYKYNGKELQETGMYDYGARMLMPDLGRWGVIDAMAEKYRRHNPYNYAVNNPVMFIDPDGNDVVQTGSGMMASGADAALAFTLFKAMSPSTSTESGSSFFTGLGPSPGGGADDNPKPGFWNRVGNWFGSLFGGKKQEIGAAGLATTGTLTRGVVNVGAATFEGVIPSLSFDVILTGLTRYTTWSLPLTLKGDMPEKEPTITLYRGVSSKIFHNDASQYINAQAGIAIPKGYYQVHTLFGPHRDMEEHAGGDNYSIWTSWSASKEVARDFATGIAFGKAVPGIIMSKKFRFSEANPNPFNPSEDEWLVPGVTYGAKVEYVLPRVGQ